MRQTNNETEDRIFMKITGKFLSITLALFFVCASAGVAGAEVMVVKAEGSAMMGERESTTKNQAFEAALKIAVTDVVSDMLSDEELDRLFEKLERDVFSKPMRYVRNYKVVAEGWVTHYDLPDAEPEAAAEAEATIEVEPGVEEPPVPHVTAPVSFAEFYHMWVEAAVDVGQLKSYLKKVTTLTEKSTISINIVILDVVDFKTYSGLKKRLENMDVVKEISYHSFSRGRFVLKAVITGTGYDFYERLTEKFGSEFVILPSGAESVIIKAGRMGLNPGGVL